MKARRTGVSPIPVQARASVARFNPDTTPHRAPALENPAHAVRRPFMAAPLPPRFAPHRAPTIYDRATPAANHSQPLATIRGLLAAHAVE
jgi:hypothetical protein